MRLPVIVASRSPPSTGDLAEQMAATSSSSPNHYASALSTEADSLSSVTEVCDKILAAGLHQPDLVMVFASHHHSDAGPRVAEEITERLAARQLIGCSAEGIVEGGREVQEGPALAVWAATLPRTRIHSMHLSFQRTAEGGAIVGWPDELVGEWPDQAVLLLLGEPFSFPADYLLQRVNEDQPGAVILGGMASGGTGPQQNWLFHGPAVRDSGAVGVLLDGGVTVTTVVSQGCRPIGDPMIVTKAERNILEQLGGRPALDQLKQIFQQLPTHEQELVQQGLHLGRTVSEYKDQFEAGDFLVRNVIGIDHESGAIAVGDYIRVGQTVQFHVRDEKSAHDDLELQLSRADASVAPGRPVVHLQRPRNTPVFRTSSRRAVDCQALWRNSARRVLCPGRDRPRGRHQLFTRLHRQHCLVYLNR